jgi:CHAT domain-containing protein/tetratricopeptide (TPR) repeat protein
MRANLPTAGWSRRLLALTLGALAGLVVPPGPAVAQTRLGEELRRADALYRADRIPQAEALYRQALTAAEGADRRHCFERLLAIYGRLGRHDQAVQTALSYRDWLRRSGDGARARQLDLDLGRWYFVLGHYKTAATCLERALADLNKAPLPPAREVTARTYLALAAEKQGDRARAEGAWREVEEVAVRLLGRGDLDLPLRIECARRLADAYRFQGQPAKALPRLRQALADFDRLKEPDPAGRRDTLRQLADHQTALDHHAGAEACLREALELHRRSAPGDRLTRADLCCELADVLGRQGRSRGEAPSWLASLRLACQAWALREQAAGDYRAVLEDPRAGRPGAAGALDAFWKLQLLYQRTNQYELAVRLIQDQAGPWAGGLVEPRLHAEQGTLQVLLGDYRAARPLLEGAVRDLARQSPVNLVALPTPQLNQAVAPRATDDRARAGELGRRCLDLYRAHRLPDDLVRVEAHDLLGACAAQDGDYARAIDHFRDGEDCCARLGRAADTLRCNLLLNTALLHKAQGDLGPALRECRKAREIYPRLPQADERGFAALDAAAAALLAAQGDLAQAAGLAGEVLGRCDRNNIRSGPLVITALHCRALFHLSRRDFPGAEEGWRKVKELHGPHSPLLPRTLNYLALTSEVQNRLEDAAGLYEAARRSQAKDPLASPVTHFITLWRLANVADARGRRDEARRLLEEAVSVAEKARLRTYGGPGQRATFFAQFAPAFEQLVAWHVRDDDVAAAVVAAARGRSRTLLDELLLGNADPRKAPRGSPGDKQREEEVRLRRQIAALHAEVQLTPSEELQTEAGRGLLAKLGAAQQEYTEVYDQILNASPVYRNLGGQEFSAAALERLRGRALGPKKLLLVYHVGRDRSYLLLLGDSSRPPEAFALTVPKDVAEQVAAPAPVPRAQALGRARGIVLRRDRKQPDLPAPQRTQEAVPLGQETLRALVENYLQHITDPTAVGRGLRLVAKDAARPLPAQRPELLAEVLLPPAARQRILAQEPEGLIVVPDGALHKLPFEALLLQAGDRPVYVLDRFPPLAYAPSVAILARLADLPPAAPGGLRSLLTVADPAYPPQAAQLLPLLHARKESERISGFFDRDQVATLLGERATKGRLVAALPGRHVVHVAAHAVAHDSFRNQFGALVLTPGEGGPADDGSLALYEIYALPLGGCELAVLSACVSNVGPQPPLEGGVSLATGFLAAGARRVVASHWGVDDEATAELMAAFFQEVTAKGPREPASFVAALQHARRKVRDRPGWEAPYFWAPFVLVGPAD